VWGQERSSTAKWRRHGSRTDERTCTLLEIVGDLVEVEEIGIAASPPPHTQTKTGEFGKIKQEHQQESIDKILGEDERVTFTVMGETRGSAKRK
jgi:hypothetical protein